MLLRGGSHENDASVEAQNHFGLLLDTAQREPVTITRRGKPVAYLMSPQDYAARNQNVGGDAINGLLKEFCCGNGGGTARLLADREAERHRE